MGNREEYYVYDGDDVVLDFVDANGATGGVSPVLKTRYLHGPAVDQILAQEELDGSGNSADVLWMLTDHLGSVRDIVNQAGEAVGHITYDAFGNIVGGTGVLLTRYLYTGRELDTLTGLQYNRNRWYDPALGRWISEDPIGRINQRNRSIPNTELIVTAPRTNPDDELALTALADGPNPYTYGANSPLIYIDAFGTDIVITPPAGPWGHQSIQVEVHDPAGKVVGILSADFSYGGSPGYCELLFGAPGEMTLYYSPDGELGKGTKYVANAKQDKAVLEWILQQAGTTEVKSGKHTTQRQYSALGYNCKSFAWQAAFQSGCVRIPPGPIGPENSH